jgi:Transposase DDE domain
LQAGRAQTGKAIGFEGALPGEKLLLRELIATAGFLDGDLADAHCSHHSRFAADHPSLGVWRRQLSHGKCSDNPTRGGRLYRSDCGKSIKFVTGLASNVKNRYPRARQLKGVGPTGPTSPTDPDARFGANNERGRFSFGYKAHIAVDQGSTTIDM